MPGRYIDHGVYVAEALPCTGCRARTTRRDEDDPSKPWCIECDHRRQRRAGRDR